jgi:heme oxygenase
MGLREATAELHSKAEKMEFNQRMFRGELTIEEYLTYLDQQLFIFGKLENDRNPINESLRRFDKIVEDITELAGQSDANLLHSTIKYAAYLSDLNDEEVLPHVYLNYLALAFGGQMMKTKVPGSGRMYDFEDMQEAIGAIRAIQKDEWADEVNKGFQFIINIADELQNNTRSDS